MGTGEIIFIYALIHILAGIYATGTDFAYSQGKYPSLAMEDRREDLGLAIFIGLLGPIGACTMFFLSGFNKYGWRLR